jgi:nucleoside-diphosphate-sugar epimerase
MMRVAVIGATGVIGRHVVQRLREHGHRVRAVARSEADIEAPRRVGIEAAPADILDHQDLREAIEGCSVALHLATAAPRPGQAPNWALNDRIRREGTANLLEACRGAGVQRYVHQSLAFLVGGSSDIVDEATPLLPATKVTASAIDAERLVAASGLDWVILRGGALYGPGTGREEHWRALARSGELRFPGDGSEHLADPCRRFGGVLHARRRAGSFRVNRIRGRQRADDLSGAVHLCRSVRRRRGSYRRRRIQFFVVPGREFQSAGNLGMATILPLLQVRPDMSGGESSAASPLADLPTPRASAGMRSCASRREWRSAYRSCPVGRN